MELVKRDEPFLTNLGGNSRRFNPHVGLLETIAWMASREPRLSDGVYQHLYGQSSSDPFETWRLLDSELNEFHRISAYAAEAALIGSVASERIEAFGRWAGRGAYEKIPAPHWIEAKLSFRGPDAIDLAGAGDDVLNILNREYWTHIRFSRSDVLRLWPENFAEMEARLQAEQRGSANATPVLPAPDEPAPAGTEVEPPAAPAAPVVKVKRSRVRQPPRWFPFLKQWYHKRFEMENRYIEQGKELPVFPTDKQLLAILKGAGYTEADTIPGSSFAYHRQKLDDEFRKGISS